MGIFRFILSVAINLKWAVEMTKNDPWSLGGYRFLGQMALQFSPKYRVTFIGLCITSDEKYKYFKKYKGFNFRELVIRYSLSYCAPPPMLCQRIRHDVVT